MSTVGFPRGQHCGQDSGGIIEDSFWSSEHHQESKEQDGEGKRAAQESASQPAASTGAYRAVCPQEMPGSSVTK